MRPKHLENLKELTLAQKASWERLLRLRIQSLEIWYAVRLVFEFSDRKRQFLEHERDLLISSYREYLQTIWELERAALYESKS